MKKPYIKSLGIAVIVIAAALIFASLKTSEKYKFEKRAEEIHAELLKKQHFMDPEQAQKLIESNDDNYIFVDIRNPRDFANFHIEDAVNVPMQRVLDDEYIPYLKNDRIKVLYSDESIDAEQVRLLLSQYGYENLMVLHGGLSYWRAHMLSRDLLNAPPEFDDEKLKFDPKKLK